MRHLLLLLFILLSCYGNSQSKFQYSLGFDANYSGIEIFYGSDQVNINAGPTEYILSVGLGLDAKYQLDRDEIISRLRYKRLGANRVIEEVFPDPTVLDIRLDLFTLDLGYRIFPTTTGAYFNFGVGLNYIFNVSKEGREVFDVIILNSKKRFMPSVSLGVGYKMKNGHDLSLTWHEGLNDFYSFDVRDMNGNTFNINLRLRSLDLSYAITFSELKKFWKHD